MQTRWRIELLGRFRASWGECELSRFPRQKAADLLAYLACARGRFASRAALIELLWPEIDPELGRNNLRKLLHTLRQELAASGGSAEALLVTDRERVALQPAAFTTDVQEFTAALQAAARLPPGAEQAAHLAEAVGLYRGELLPDRFEPWVLTEREALRQRYLQALQQLVAALEAAGDLAGALRRAREAVRADPLREEAHYDLMRLLAATGQPSACLRQYQELERVLREELDETPSAEARALAEELRRHARTLVVARRPAHQRVPSARSPVPGGEGQASLAHRELRIRPPAPGTENQEPRTAHRAPGTSLPAQSTRFFGREEEITRLMELLASPGPLVPRGAPRLVTITGPGGSGKTRLAIAVAGRLHDPFRAAPPPPASDEAITTKPHGVTPRGDGPDPSLPHPFTHHPLRGYPPPPPPPAARVPAPSSAAAGGLAFVPLADVTDARQIPAAIAAALGLAPDPNREPLEQVVEHLRGHTQGMLGLLVLDNFEHLVEEGTLLLRMLLDQIPTLTCLATSRQSLGLSGEQEFALLPLPTPRRSETLEHLRDYASVQLFLDRARATHAGFQLTEENAAAVAELCDRLEGLPLALELAAARAGVLTPQQMLQQLTERFAFLVSRQRDVPPRHRTLRAAIDSSYQLLTPELQRFFARLAVFRGGWTLEAAHAVCGEGCRVWGVGCREETTGPYTLHPTPYTLDALQQLRDCSLIQVEEGGAEVRYRLLETLREYGWEQLAAAGELTAVRSRHRDWYLQLAEQADAAQHRPEQKQWLTRLEAELDNLRAALGWCQEEAESKTDLPLSALPTIHYPLPTASEAGLRLATALGWLWHSRGYLTEGLYWLEGMLARSSELPAKARAPALHRAKSLAGGLGDWQRSRTFLQAARREYEQLLTLARAEENRTEIAWTLQALVEIIGEDGDLPLAWSLCAETRQLFEELGEPVGLARVLESMSAIASGRGDRQAARPLREECLALRRALGDAAGLVHVLGGMGHLERDEGDYPRARALYQESLRLRWELGDRHALAQSLEDLAVLAGREGQAARVARLLGAAEVLCKTLEARPPVAVGPGAYNRTIAEGRAALGEAAFAAAWAEGRAMSLEQAVEHALGGE